jgi:hypothetical protein
MISHGNLLFAFKQAFMIAQDRTTVAKVGQAFSLITQ